MISLIFAASLMTQPAQEIQLRQGYARTESQAVDDLNRYRSLWSTSEEWSARAALIRSKILDGTGLNPLPERTPLNPNIHSLREYDGYSVESITLEVAPGYFAYGSLYVPTGLDGPFAAVLCPHGHGRQPNGGGRFRPANQSRSAVLARMGAVVFGYDMIGYGDSGLQGWHHDGLQAMTLQLWTSMRIVDYLQSRDDVDPDRIAITGASGGGTQSFMLAAVDDRIAVSVPVVQVSADFYGGCICESGLPIHVTADHETNNVEIAAAAAPRPQMIISDGDDWTKNSPRVEVPYIREVYGSYNKAHLLDAAHFADEGHDYGPSKRQSAYRFLTRHLRLNPFGVLQANGSFDESFVEIEPFELMRAASSKHPLPDHALEPNSVVDLPRP